MAAPITNNPDNCSGHIVTVVIDYTSGGVANTVTIPAGLPRLDLAKAHPLFGGASVLTAANTDASECSANYASKEMKRGTAADSANEFSIMTGNTVSYYTTHVNGKIMVTYFAAGSKNT